MTGEAFDIYQAFLDEMGAALLAGDADGFLARIFLPHLIETENLRIVVETKDEARHHFDGFHAALLAQGVDAYIRTARDAWFEGQHRIKGHHESFMMSGGTLVVPRFRNEATLEHRRDVWGCTLTRHHARYVSWPDILPRGEAGA